MARLTLDEGGTVRRFKLSSGKLTFGSGEGVTLKLASDDVAERHGSIQMGPDGATLEVAKGVMPAKAAGVTISGSHLMKDGQAITIGSAKLTIEYDEGEGPAARPAPVSKGAGSKGAGSKGAGSKGAGRQAGRSAGRSSGESSKPRAAARRRQQSRGPSIPTPVVVGGIVLVAVVGVYQLFSSTSKNLAGENFDFNATWQRYQREVKEDPVGARATLTRINDQELTLEQRRLVDAALEVKDEMMEGLDDSVRNQKITPWVDSRVIKYSESRWNPKGERAHARLFVKRAKWFVTEYPTHPRVAQVRRLMERIEPVAELGTPDTFEDVRVDTWGSTAAEPMDFREAFEAVARFARTAEGGDKTAIEQLRQELVTAEREFYDEKLADAAVVYDRVKYPKKYNPTDAVEDMVRIIVGCQNESLREDAARRLLLITEFTPALLADYKRTQPDRYARLIGEPGIKAFAVESGLE